LCGACYEACPVKIPLHDMLVQLRARKVKLGLTPIAERAAFKTFQTTFGNVTLYKVATKSAYYLQKPFISKGFIKKGPGPMSGWTQSRFFPMKPKQSFRDRWSALQQELKAGSGAAATPTAQMRARILRERHISGVTCNECKQRNH